MKTKLTRHVVEKTKPGPADQFVWDTEITGFALKVTPGGRKTFILQYRTAGGRKSATRRLGLGVCGNITVDEARKLAHKAHFAVANGRDPSAERRTAVAARANTLAAVTDVFLDRHGRTVRPRTLSELRRMLASEALPVLGHKPIAEITRPDLVDLRDAIVARGHLVTANKTMAMLKQVFAFAIERQDIEHSPAAGMSRLRETPRTRTLDDDELRAIWQATAKMGWPFGPYIRLLMLTAARRDEVAHIRWAELSEDMTIWTLPPERTKTGEGRIIKLPAAATALLREQPHIGSAPWVFTISGLKPVRGYTMAKDRIDKLSGISGWVFHDFRRTCATWLAKADFDPHIAEAVLGHAPVKGIAAVYNVHKYADRCHLALEAWAAHLAGEDEAKVLSFRRTEG
jgi:integrase